MIDTDKYEGHTLAPWKWKKDSILLKGKGHRYIITGRHLDDECSIDKEADAQLIADAPLLLAEVKRLRELADNLYDFAKWMQDEKRKHPIGLEVLKDRMYWRNEE